jgi:hypothetical protein
MPEAGKLGIMPEAVWLGTMPEAVSYAVVVDWSTSRKLRSIAVM